MVAPTDGADRPCFTPPNGGSRPPARTRAYPPSPHPGPNTEVPLKRADHLTKGRSSSNYSSPEAHEDFFVYDRDVVVVPALPRRLGPLAQPAKLSRVIPRRAWPILPHRLLPGGVSGRSIAIRSSCTATGRLVLTHTPARASKDARRALFPWGDIGWNFRREGGFDNSHGTFSCDGKG